jgi:hypothetical protein
LFHHRYLAAPFKAVKNGSSSIAPAEAAVLINKPANLNASALIRSEHSGKFVAPNLLTTGTRYSFAQGS